MDHLETLAYNFLQAENYEEGNRVFSDVLSTDDLDRGDLVKLMRGWGQFRAAAHHWREAAECFSKAVDMDPDDIGNYYRLALLQIESGNSTGFRNNSDAALARFGATDNVGIAQETAKFCLLLPDVATSLPIASKLADACLANTNVWFYRQCEITKGLAEYRQGHFANAIERCQKLLNNPVHFRNEIEAGAILSMASFQLNKTNDARAALSKARETIKTKMSDGENGIFRAAWSKGEVTYNWADWLVAHILLREAQALIQGKPVQPNL